MEVMMTGKMFCTLDTVRSLNEFHASVQNNFPKNKQEKTFLFLDDTSVTRY